MSGAQNTVGVIYFIYVIFSIFRFFANIIGRVWSILIRTISRYPGSKYDPHPESDWFGWAIMLSILTYFFYGEDEFPYIAGFVCIIILRAILATYYIVINKMPSIIDYEN